MLLTYDSQTHMQKHIQRRKKNGLCNKFVSSVYIKWHKCKTHMHRGKWKGFCDEFVSGVYDELLCVNWQAQSPWASAMYPKDIPKMQT